MVKLENTRSNLKNFYSRSSFFISNNDTNLSKLDLSFNSQQTKNCYAEREIDLYTSLNMSNYADKENAK